MHIGLIVGIGPAATDDYYRQLINAFGIANKDLTLTMPHADTKTRLKNQAEANQQAQIEIYTGLANRLMQCGEECLAITSIAGHFCIQQFIAVSPIPVIDLLGTVKQEVDRLNCKQVGLLGTRLVMETGFYGALSPGSVLAPTGIVSDVHEAYVAMASCGVATQSQRDVFIRAGRHLTQEQGCESALLAGTDLALVFNDTVYYGFQTFDCARVHADAIAKIAMQSHIS